MTRRLVDNDALTALCMAAARPHPDPVELRAALATLAAAESQAPSRPWVSIGEVARTLGVSERTVRRHANAGTLPSRRIGRRLLIASQALSGRVRTGPDTSRDGGGDDRHAAIRDRSAT